MSAKNDVWVYIQQDGGTVADVSVELLCKARELADRLEVGVSGVLIGSDVQSEAKELIAYGVDNIFCVEDERLKDYTPTPYANVVAQLIRQHEPQIVLYGATTTGRDVAPRIASILKVGLTADCTDLHIGDGSGEEEDGNILHQMKPAFGGNVVATIVSPEHRPQMATVREGVMKVSKPRADYPGVVTPVKVELTEADFPTTIVERVNKGRRADLKSARIIVSGGMGVGSKENFRLVEELAQTLGAEVGATRAAVDAGFVTRDRLVGQTGITVRPTLYVACGISGSVQHRAGMDESSRILAINTDRDAPIFHIAHYGIVGDIKEVIPKLIKSYKAQ